MNLARKINRTTKARKRKQSRRAWRKKLYDARLAAAKNHLDSLLPLKFPRLEQQIQAHVAGSKLKPRELDAARYLATLTGRQKSALLTTCLAYTGSPNPPVITKNAGS